MKNKFYVLMSATLIVLTLLTNSTVFAATNSSTLSSDYGNSFVIMGDVDYSGKIDATDCIIVKRHLLGISHLSDRSFEAADIDRNGKVDSTDYIALKRVVLGIDSPQVSAIEYFFNYISDMETFINTGSRDVNDYLKINESKLSDLPKVDLSKRYIPVASKLGIDENKFTDHEASFQFAKDGKIEYRYYLDNSFVIIKETNANSVEDYVNENFKDFKKENVIPYQASEHISEGYIERVYNGTKVIYAVQRGVKRLAVVLFNGYAITINGTCYSDYTGTLEKDYQEFMTAEKTAGMAALFSDDQETFNATVNKIINNNEQEIDEPCAIEYLFYSIADMETFIYTGSRDVKDYSKKPYTSFDLMPTKDFSERYIQLASKMGIDENEFTDHEASFQFSVYGKLECRYYLDNTIIIFKETNAASIEDYMSENFRDFKKDDVKPYNADAGITEGFVVRECDGVKVIYKMQNGIKRVAVLLSNGYAITINGTYYSDYTGTLGKDFQEFMTSEKTAGMAALFSDDDNIFRTALSNI